MISEQPARPMTLTLGTPHARAVAQEAGLTYRRLADGRIRIQVRSRDEFAALRAASRRVEDRSAHIQEEVL